MTPSRRVLALVGAVLVAVIVVVALPVGRDDGPQAADLTVTWGGSEGNPACIYDEAGQSVEATITIDGEAGDGTAVTITVTAYADENTSRAVGSGTRTVDVEGTVHDSVVVPMPVTKPPFVDIDGVAACGLDVSY